MSNFKRIGKKISIVILIVTIIGIFFGLNTFAGQNQKKVTVGIVVRQMTNEWHREVARGITEVIEGAGGRTFITDARGDMQKHAEDFQGLIAKNVDLICVQTGDPMLMKTGTALAGKANIPVIAVEILLEGPTVETYVYVDQLINGIMSANNIIDYLAFTKGKVEGKVLIPHTPGNNTLDRRYKGLMLKLTECPNIEIVTLPHDFANPIESTRATVESYLKANPDVDVVGPLFGETMVGSSLAIEGLRMADRVKVIGIDAFENVMELMRAGKPIIAAVHQDAYAMGTVVGKLALKILNGEQVSYQYFLPLTSIYANFPGKPDNFPIEGLVKIPCPNDFKTLGLDWGY